MKHFWRNTFIVTFLSIFFSMSMNAQTEEIKPTKEAVDNLKFYPSSVNDYVRYVIYLNQLEDENLSQVELIPGKMMDVDCNDHLLMGEFLEETIDGWGYTYYIFKSDGEVASTMMACPGAKENKFVSGKTLMVRYNSRLPLVVYLPKDMDLKYKLWMVTQELSAEKQ